METKADRSLLLSGHLGLHSQILKKEEKKEEEEEEDDTTETRQGSQ